MRKPLTLIDLPTEILVEILVEIFRGRDQDLASLRLTCKQLCNAVTRRFGIVNFTERTHVVTPYSTRALIDITEHPEFGKYVESISICCIRQTVIPEGLPPDSVTLNGYVTTKRFACDIERVFTNIKALSGSVTISIKDYPLCGKKWGRTREFGEHWMPVKCYGYEQLFQSSADLKSRHLLETLEETIYAARRARCPVRHLKIVRKPKVQSQRASVVTLTNDHGWRPGYHLNSVGHNLQAGSLHKYSLFSLKTLLIMFSLQDPCRRSCCDRIQTERTQHCYKPIPGINSHTAEYLFVGQLVGDSPVLQSRIPIAGTRTHDHLAAPPVFC